MKEKMNYTEKLQKMVKKRKTDLIIEKQGKKSLGFRKTIRSLTHESYSFEDN